MPTSSRLRDAAADHGPAGGRLGDPAEDFEQRALAGAVAADDADHFALGHLERHVLQSPNDVLGVAVCGETC